MKGRSWPFDIREKIREGCLNRSVGMGPKPAQAEELQEVNV